jgi:hypothetical protein
MPGISRLLHACYRRLPHRGANLLKSPSTGSITAVVLASDKQQEMRSFARRMIMSGYAYHGLVATVRTSREVVMTVRIHVRSAFLAALMLAGTIETAENDEESAPRAGASRNAGLASCGCSKITECCAETRRVRKPSRGSYGVRSPTLFSVSKSKAFHGRFAFRHLTLNVADNPSRQGTQFNTGTSYAATHPNRVPNNPGKGRRAVGKSTRGASRPTSDI